MIGLHLLLSRVGTAGKPACPLCESSNALSRSISRRHARSVEDYRCDLCTVHFNEIAGPITCKSVRFGQSAKASSMSRSAELVFSQRRMR